MTNGLKIWTCFLSMLLFVNVCPVHSSAFPSSPSSVEGKFSTDEVVKELNKPLNVELLKKSTVIVYNRDKNKIYVKDKRCTHEASMVTALKESKTRWSGSARLEGYQKKAQCDCF